MRSVKRVSVVSGEWARARSVCAMCVFEDMFYVDSRI
jgi:hypothetical protein